MDGFLDDLPDLGMPERRKKPIRLRTQGTGSGQAQVTGDGSRETVVRYVRIRCPQCGYDRVPVTHTDPPSDGYRVRFHKCENPKCGYNFKSIETIKSDD